MKYTLHQLQVFLKVAELQNITKAAEELHLTQPAVSIQVKNLQEQFAIPIVEIVGRKVFITDFGAEIQQAASRIVDELHLLNSKAAAYKGELVGRLKITVVSTGKYVIPSFLSDFIKQHPGIDLVLDVTNRSRVIESLEKNEVDFALVSVLPDHLQVDGLELMGNRLYLVGSKEVEVPEEPLEKEMLKEIPLIFREPGSGTRSVMEKFFKQNNFSVIKKMELTSNEAVKQAVIADLGYSIMPLIGIKNEINREELKVIPVKGLPIKSKWSLIWLRSKQMSPVAQSYKEYIKKEKARIIQERFSYL